MSDSGLHAAVTRMRAAGVNEPAIATFTAYYRQLEAGATGLVPESAIDPVADLPHAVDLPVDGAALEAFGKTVMIRLNGGLGTSMGLSKAKTLLGVRDGMTFLDIIVEQVLHARRTYGVRLPLLLLHSFSTREDSLAALAKYPELPVEGLPLDVVQSQEPKLRQDDLEPVTWEANPRLEWCPPGHGDLYPSLLASGVLDELLSRGFRYASVSNSDNLGCSPDPALAGWFARSGAPFAAEVTPRTPMDVKGGHLARRKSDGRIILRETAQTPDEDMRWFTDPDRHPYANCNNLWMDLRALQDTLMERGGVMGLPLIRNAKTVDPADPSSTPVVQVESAMGAAIEVFDGATGVVVPRSRFVPVKTTNDLLLLRSDVYAFGGDMVPRATVAPLPVVTLGSAYKRIGDFDDRIPHAPSLREASVLDVQGDWRFGSSVSVVGDVTLGPEGGTVPSGAVLK